MANTPSDTLPWRILAAACDVRHPQRAQALALVPATLADLDRQQETLGNYGRYRLQEFKKLLRAHG